jgi:hypothetical protein
VIKPFDGKAATVGNGMMVAIMCDSHEKVKAIYDKAIKLGAKDEGPPGTRWGNFYVGYFRDLDGNKLNAFCMVLSASPKATRLRRAPPRALRVRSRLSRRAARGHTARFRQLDRHLCGSA